MKIGAVILARLDSRRLPGKALIQVAGRPLLGHVIDICRHVVGLDAIALATSDRPEDDVLETFAHAEGIACVRGSLDDVAGRFLTAMRQLNLDGALRLNGDSPLNRPALLSQAVERFRRGGWDLVTNVVGRSYPFGVSAEVIGYAAMERACTAMHIPEHREHVTKVFYDNPEQVRMDVLLNVEPGMNGVQLAVDDQTDLERFRWIAARRPDFITAPLSDLVALARTFEIE
ncbi:NTP transferase domain-containing protein [Magnetospirillum sp. 64-120]|uniref:cytidylyltransferase domain-containing protein n=1 Tax=Magnetospirillum sp. 64-120 TaxID=1895778 RepID=UPI000926FA7B|nr:NTP transferase domain-containing protein [Magnetospirillum sp. 64-120]OJX68193.1 MAG: hypothetical protein BGO92_05940 [Magnetospirillum sp. 64-120]